MFSWKKKEKTLGLIITKEKKMDDNILTKEKTRKHKFEKYNETKEIKKVIF